MTLQEAYGVLGRLVLYLERLPDEPLRDPIDPDTIAVPDPHIAAQVIRLLSTHGHA